MSANPIDLTNISAVRGYLSLVTAIVNTTVALPIFPGLQTVTPGSMIGIAVGCYLYIGSGATGEYVLVTAVTSTTFTAFFNLAHATGASVLDKTDAVLQWMISGASEAFLSNCGLASLNSINTFTENYDGNGNNTLMLRQNPIVSVIYLNVNGRSIQSSTSPNLPGYVIDALQKSIAIRWGGTSYSIPFNFATLAAWQGGGWAGGGFPRGVQNIQVQYTAGFPATPYDVFDKVTQMVAVNYKRTNWIDQASQSLQGTGSVTGFRSWMWPPEVAECISRYQRSSRS